MSHLLSSPRHRALVLILVPLFLLAVSAQSLMLVAVTAMAVVFVADLQTDPMNEARYDEGLMGLSCLSKNVASSSKRDALDALNCLVFETPNNYWYTNAADVKTASTTPLSTTVPTIHATASRTETGDARSCFHRTDCQSV